jgi:hypothetical protein
MGSLEDLIDCQKGRAEIPDFQVGKGKKMNSAESSYKQGELMEEDHRNILIIGGIQIFLPSSPVEAKVCVADATTEEGQPTVTVIEEMEQMLISSPTEEEHAVKMFTPWEELEMLEDWLNNPKLEDSHEDCKRRAFDIIA